MTRADFKEALRTAVSDEFAAVPNNEAEIDHTFSARFEKQMRKLVKAEKSVGWHWVNTVGKRTAIVTAALLCVLTVAFIAKKPAAVPPVEGAQVPPPYVLKEENGKFYMQFSDEYLKSIRSGDALYPDMSTQIPAPRTALKFSTVTEMKNAFETGNFSEENLIALANRAKKGVVEIPDPDKLRAPDLPAGIEVKGIWNHITNYDIAISSNYDCQSDNCHDDYFVIDLVGDNYESRFDETIVNYADAAKTVISERDIEDRNAKEFIYTNDTGKYKQLLYQIESDGRVLHVMEFYIIEYYYPDSSFHYISETIPLRIKIFCQEDDVAWRVALTAFEERPTVEWLASFGIKEIAE